MRIKSQSYLKITKKNGSSGNYNKNAYVLSPLNAAPSCKDVCTVKTTFGNIKSIELKDVSLRMQPLK